MINSINSALESLESNPDVNSVILTGKGKSFGVGADINEFHASSFHTLTFDDHLERSWFRVIPVFKKPLIAAVNGLCFGGGLELALMCDMIFASDDSKLGFPEVKLGLFPCIGGT